MNQQHRYSGEQLDSEIFDSSRWPVVFLRFPALEMPNRTDRLLAGLTHILTQQQRVALVWIPARHGHEREPHEQEKQASRWMKQYKNELRDYCAGYVYLTCEPEVRESLSAMFPKVKKILPFPKTLADDMDDAYLKATAFLALDGAVAE